MRGAATVAALTVAALCALPAATDASGGHAWAARVLSIGKATEVTKRVAERDCRRDENCEASNAANCRRLAPRRVSCVASNVGADASGPYQCDRLVIVRLGRGGETKHAAGRPSCYEIRAG